MTKNNLKTFAVGALVLLFAPITFPAFMIFAVWHAARGLWDSYHP